MTDCVGLLGTVCELEASWPSLDFIFDTFSQLSRADVDKILDTVRLTTHSLNLCPSWLVKTSSQGIRASLVDIIYLFSFKKRVFTEGLRRPWSFHS